METIERVCGDVQRCDKSESQFRTGKIVVDSFGCGKI
jgi:hypothetical protein